MDLCGDAFRHGALVDALEATFRAAAGTDRTAKAVVLHQRLGAPGCGNIIANEGFHLARVDPSARAASLVASTATPSARTPAAAEPGAMDVVDVPSASLLLAPDGEVKAVAAVLGIVPNSGAYGQQ